MTTLTIPAHFNGPPRSANGGWFAGSAAGFVRDSVPDADAVRVRLSAPPPLEVPLTVSGDAAAYRMTHGETLVATAEPAAALAPTPVGPVSLADAVAAGERYEGLAEHPFPTCYSCGTGRADGLGLRPGSLGRADGAYAAAWVPTEVSVPIVWAALDCPGGWSAGIAGRAMVLGTMTAAVPGLPEVGEECVVMAWPGSSSGRRFDSGTALFGADGRLLGRADAVWIAVDPAAIRPR